MASKRTFIIAEIGQAHDGSIGILHSLVKAAASIGVDAVKFQVHIAEAESSMSEPFRINFSHIDATRFDYWKRMELPFKEWEILKALCDDLGVEFLATPFSNAAVDLLEKIGVKRYKIGSGDASNHLLLEKVCNTEKEIILSSGMSSTESLDETIGFLKKHKSLYSILQCTTKYPTKAEDIGLKYIDDFKQRYNCPVGLSDHSGKIYAGIAAVAVGASIIEAHITFDKRMFGPDAESSLTVKDFSKLVEGIRFTEKATTGYNKEALNKNSTELARIFGKSLSVNKDLKKGHIVSYDDLEGKKPSDIGIPINQYTQIIGKQLTQDKKRGDFLIAADIYFD
ncbi:MAG: N-acetylneuraminate synthase [Kordiimonadaceae bacterium]|jgi:N,N'-diacetyllegionaminate synthase|nr:N-acetylneuraminate synthase [Kordiimonadaceae bacterium]